MNYNISYTCFCHIGKVRKINQDNFICDGHFLEDGQDGAEFPLNGTKTSKEQPVFGVFDGMGGEECGEVASGIAAKTAAGIEIGKDAVADLSDFCQKANGAICDYADGHEVLSMGTTAAMLAFTEKDVVLCNIGDSKIFRFCDSILEQISEDHVSIAPFGVKPPLSQNLGIPPSELRIDPYFARGPYHDGDIYLICSDGLTDMVSVDEINGVLASEPPEEAAKLLLEKALAAGGRDNTTILLCEVRRGSGWPFRRKHRAKEETGEDR